MQYNSTFYKTWNDVTSKSRLHLLVDQLVHYMTTYGTDFTDYHPYSSARQSMCGTYEEQSQAN